MTISLERCIATNVTPASLRAVAAWNEDRSRKVMSREKSHEAARRQRRQANQAVALRKIAQQLANAYADNDVVEIRRAA